MHVQPRAPHTTRLGAGPASSVSLVRLTTRLLASTKAFFGRDGIDPEEGRLVMGVKLRSKDLDDIPVTAGVFAIWTHMLM